MVFLVFTEFHYGNLVAGIDTLYRLFACIIKVQNILFI